MIADVLAVREAAAGAGLAKRRWRRIIVGSDGAAGQGMVEIVESVMPGRAAVRDYVAGKAAVLEAAQASGRLARVKIDLRDEADGLFAVGTVDEKAALRGMLDEEIEALCSDLRLASVTVQSQVERRARHWGFAIAVAICVFVGGVVVLIGIGEPDAGIGFGVPLLAAVVAFFVSL